MPVSVGRSLAIIFTVAGTIFFTRLIPFLLFPKGKEIPPIIRYLGRVLPPAVIAMLIVYCLKGVTFTTLGGWLPSLIAGVAAVVLHLWKGNELISIFGATGLYMVLVQVVFA